MDYFIFFAAVWGVSAGIAFSKLTSPMLDGLEAYFVADEKKPSFLSFLAVFLLTLFRCPMCIGFHVAWIACVAEFSPEPPTAFHALRLAFCAAGINLILAVAVERMDAR